MLNLCMLCVGCTLGIESMVIDSVHVIKLGMESAGPAAAHRSMDSLASIRECYFEQ